MAMTPNAQQSAVYQWGNDSTGSLNLVARAGCGKTSTLVELSNQIDGRAFLGAFNKAIAEELKVRIKSPNVVAGTMHSLGFSLWRKIKSKSEIDSRKVFNLAKRMCPADKPLAIVVASAVAYAKQAGFGLKGKDYTEQATWDGLLDHYDLLDELPAGVSRETLLEKAISVYDESLEMCMEKTSVIDFDDMILAPLYYGESKPNLYDWVMIDEAQDTNETRRRLAMWVLKPGGRMVAVGDPCQPAGTIVTTVYGKLHKNDPWGMLEDCPIEQIKVGDKVLSYNPKDTAFIQGRKVLGITKRKYSGRLIRITTTSGRTSAYTPNHHCLVNFSALRDKFAVYLMRKDGKYRLGSAFMNYGSVIAGPIARMVAEQADACWILAFRDSKMEARILEGILSANYGLPELMFTVKNNSAITQHELDAAWSQINPNEDRAVKCLKDFGRELVYPLATSDRELYKESLKRPTVTRACNIMDGCLVLPHVKGSSGHAKKASWERVKVSEENYDGLVYSLSVEKEQLYCADGIITHNCQAIYGFAGANHDSMDLIKEAMASVVLPLSITYRCPKAVVAHVQQWVPDITAHESAPEGDVHMVDHRSFWLHRFDPQHDVLLCRNTRPLLGVAKRLRKSGIPCVVEGTSGKSLIALATKWGDDIEIREMEMRVGEYRKSEVDKWMGKQREDKADSIAERCDMLLDIAEDMNETDSVDRLVQQIERMFADGPDKEGVLHLCTIHRSKGREWKRVFVLGANIYQPSKWAKKAWEQKQEQNLQYVAATRAKEELIYVECPKKKSSESPEWWEL